MAKRTEPPPPRTSRKARRTYLLTVVVLLFVVSLFFGPTAGSSFIQDLSRNGNYRGWQRHKSVEERVKHILEHTPLIGNDCILLRASSMLRELSLNF